MFKKLLIAATAAAATLTAGAASAQAAPMDMSWAIQSQMRNQAMGDYMAQQALWQAYYALARARAAGHPFNGTLVLGNHPNTFDNGYAARAQVQAQTAYDYDQRAVRGNCPARDAYGNIYYYSC